MMGVHCSECGKQSDRGFIRLCRDCSPLPGTWFLCRSNCCYVISRERISPHDKVLTTIGEYDRAQKQVDAQ